MKTKEARKGKQNYKENIRKKKFAAGGNGQRRWENIPKIGDLKLEVNTKAFFNLLKLVLLFVSDSAHAVRSAKCKLSLDAAHWEFVILEMLFVGWGIHDTTHWFDWV